MSAPGRFTTATVGGFLSKIRPLFPCLRKHFDNAVCFFKEGLILGFKFSSHYTNKIGSNCENITLKVMKVVKNIGKMNLLLLGTQICLIL